MEKNRIVLSTKNRGKIEEIREFVKGRGFSIIGRDEAGIPSTLIIEEDGDTFEENSFKKAYEIMKVCGKPTMADDSGLKIDYLDGAPGVLSARFAGEDGDDRKNNEKVLDLLRGVPLEKRGAHFETVITLVYPDGSKLVAKGQCFGKIGLEPAGEAGFGYDPLFIPDGYQKTFAQLGHTVKDKISHRAKALMELERLLDEKTSNRNF